MVMTKEELALEKAMNTPEYWGIGKASGNVSHDTKSDVISKGAINKDIASLLGNAKYEDLKNNGKGATFLDFANKKSVVVAKEKVAMENYEEENTKIANGESDDDDYDEYIAILED